MAKGLGIMIGIPSKKSMYEHDGAESDDEAPESSRGEEKDEDLSAMKVLFPAASKDDLPDMLEAFKSIVGQCMAEGGESEEDEAE